MSLHFLGTEKIVAGTPDAADFKTIKTTETQLIDSNNRQVLINTDTETKKGEVLNTPHLFETLMTRIRMLITEIQNYELFEVKFR